jgi:hypothetical protein
LGSIREIINTSAKENPGFHRLKHSKTWFDDKHYMELGGIVTAVEGTYYFTN